MRLTWISAVAAGIFLLSQKSASIPLLEIEKQCHSATETIWSLYPTGAQPRVCIIFLIRHLPLGPQHTDFPCMLC